MHRLDGLKALRLGVVLGLLVVVADLTWAIRSVIQSNYDGARYIADANIYVGVALVLLATCVSVRRLVRLTVREMGRDEAHPVFNR